MKNEQRSYSIYNRISSAANSVGGIKIRRIGSFSSQWIPPKKIYKSIVTPISFLFVIFCALHENIII